MTKTVKELYDATMRGEGMIAKHAALNPDMPVFVLIAQDQNAGPLVERWAIHTSTAIPDASEDRGTHNKVHEAREIADLMYRWPIHKVAD